ncbi:head-tail connector protein [Sphingomonas sp. RIT328]|uniref:head-tail connector protein n=1 Tax=Sphingomonas sp. RIT328 TaxID=1470591 RepID=UPI0013777027|nr:hypothetical protein [Sphingomonas sp. RIT328]
MTLKAVAPLDAEAALPMKLLMQHLKDPEGEDLIVASARTGALDWLEKRVGISLTRRSWRATYTDLTPHERAIGLPMGPASIDAITYSRLGVAPQVWPAASYFFDGIDLRTTSGISMFAAFGDLTVTIDYQAGYLDLGAEEPALQTAALLLAGHFYRNREENTAAALASMPFGVEMLIGDIRTPVMA